MLRSMTKIDEERGRAQRLVWDWERDRALDWAQSLSCDRAWLRAWDKIDSIVLNR